MLRGRLNAILFQSMDDSSSAISSRNLLVLPEIERGSASINIVMFCHGGYVLLFLFDYVGCQIRVEFDRILSGLSRYGKFSLSIDSHGRVWC